MSVASRAENSSPVYLPRQICQKYPPGCYLLRRFDGRVAEFRELQGFLDGGPEVCHVTGRLVLLQVEACKGDRFRNNLF